MPAEVFVRAARPGRLRFEPEETPRTVTTIVYTDGACSGNPGPGGWAWAVVDGPFAAGPAMHTTNQRMEVTAAFEALVANEGQLEIRSDSTYVVNCFRDRWWEGWLARGWRNSQRKDVANRDLWEPFLASYQARGGAKAITFTWVKGHAGDPWNERVDELAVASMRAQQPLQGTAAQPGAASDSVSVRPRAVATAARRLVVFGPRQIEDPAALRRRLTKLFLDRRAANGGDVEVVSGLRLGAESLAADTALALELPLRVVLPFAEPDLHWEESERAHFGAQLAAAASCTVVDAKVPGSPQALAAALRRRDAAISDQADEAIVIWDGRDERLGSRYRALVDRLGFDAVFPLDPAVEPGIATEEHRWETP